MGIRRTFPTACSVTFQPPCDVSAPAQRGDEAWGLRSLLKLR